MLLHRQDTYKGNPWQPWTQNLYVYVGNNPVNFVDPTGHEPAIPGGGRSTWAEIATCAGQGLFDCYKAYQYTTLAPQVARQMYPSSGLWNDPGDAFRHAFWNAMMVANISDNDIAEVIATKHEMVHAPTTAGGKMEQTMDLYNNSVGRAIGAALKGKSQDEIAQAIKRAVSSGNMLTIQMGNPQDDSTWKMTWSDGVEIVWVNGKPYRKEDTVQEGETQQ